MASKTAVLAVRVVTDAKAGTKGMNDAATGVEKFQKRISGLQVPAALALAAVGKLAKGAIDSGSALEQSSGGVESIFKAHAGTVKGFASEAATNVGLATSQYQELATVIGAQLKNMGTPMEAVAGQTDNLVTLGADLAATFGGSTADAVAALSSLLKGERDPIERYGVAINEAAIKAKTAELGLTGLTGEAEKNAKLQATLALLTDQTADAQGGFAREATTAAGAQAIATAKAEDAQAKIGKGLLPVYTKFQTALGTVATFLGENSEAVLAVGLAIAGLAAGILIINGVMKAYVAVQAAVKIATGLWTAAQWLLNAAMTANPIGLIIIAIAAVIAIVALLWNKCEGFRKIVLAVWEAIRKAAGKAWEWIKAAIKVVIDAVKIYINTYKAVVLAVWNAIKTAATAAWNFIKAAIKVVIDAVKIYINTYKAVVLAVWTGIKTAASTAWNGIKAAIKIVVDWIKAAIRTARDVINGVWNKIKDVASSVWTKIQTSAKTALDKIMIPINAVKGAFDNVWSVINNVIGAIGRIKFPSLPSWMSDAGSAVGDLFGANSVAGGDASALMRTAALHEPQPAALVGAASFGASSGSGLRGSLTPVYNITVNGALDPLAVGRQIESILARTQRRHGTRNLGQGLFA